MFMKNAQNLKSHIKTIQTASTKHRILAVYDSSKTVYSVKSPPRKAAWTNCMFAIAYSKPVKHDN